MAGIVPNTGATYPRQAVLDTVDLEAIQMGSNLTGVVSGCATTTAGGVMTVAVAAGVVRIAGKPLNVTGATSAAMTADGTNPRWYLVTVSTAGAIVVTAGTAAADPKLPAIPATSVVVAAVYLPAGTSAITSGMIVDKRVTVPVADVIDVTAYGAVGDGTTDDTTAIQNALNAGGGDRIIRFGPKPGYTFRVTDTLLVKSRTVLWGWSKTGSDGGTVITFDGSDGEHCFKSDIVAAGGNCSRIIVQGLRLEDQVITRTSGNGFHMERVDNGLQIRDCHTSGFWDGYYIGGTTGGSGGDSTHISDVWCTRPERYGINIERSFNHVLVQNVFSDSEDGYGTDAIIRIGNTGGSSPITLIGIKHECGNGAHTVLIESNATVQCIGITQRVGSPFASGGDVIRITDTDNGAGVTCQGIATYSTAFADASTVASNLINVTNISFTIAGTAGRVNYWSGARGVNPAFQLGKVGIYTGSGSPESVVTAPVGSMYFRDDGGSGTCLYAKESGTGNTGWVAR